jgi:hypothetical protein
MLAAVRALPSTVMTGLVPVIHVEVSRTAGTWMPATEGGHDDVRGYGDSGN